MATGKAIVSKRNQWAVRAGAVQPAVQIQHLSPDGWEEFITEACCRRVDPKYALVKKLGGPGDKGRDVECRLTPERLPHQWDLYQAKNYRGSLSVAEILPELAKFLVHLSMGTYPEPRRYYLCAPLGASTDLFDFLAEPARLRQRLLDDWAGGKSGLKVRQLTDKVKATVNAFDFARLEEVQCRDLLEWHAKDVAAHRKRFGIESVRGDDPVAPDEPAEIESNYLSELVRAYSEHCGIEMTVAQASSSPEYGEHLIAIRKVFYCAEGLKCFSRDNYPDEDKFGEFLSSVHNGIRSQLTHPRNKTGMARLDAATAAAQRLQITDGALASRLRGGDLEGSCHHLVNDGRFTWVR